MARLHKNGDGYVIKSTYGDWAKVGAVLLTLLIAVGGLAEWRMTQHTAAMEIHEGSEPKIKRIDTAIEKERKQLLEDIQLLITNAILTHHGSGAHPGVDKALAELKQGQAAIKDDVQATRESVIRLERR